jgi:hypothetical protein
MLPRSNKSARPASVVLLGLSALLDFRRSIEEQGPEVAGYCARELQNLPTHLSRHVLPAKNVVLHETLPSVGKGPHQ